MKRMISFDPKLLLTPHDVEVQIHTIESILKAALKTGMTSIPLQFLDTMIILGYKELEILDGRNKVNGVIKNEV